MSYQQKIDEFIVSVCRYRGFPPIELQNDKEKMVVAINKNDIKRIDKYKKSINQQPLLFSLQFSNVWAKTKVLTILKTDHS